MTTYSHVGSLLGRLFLISTLENIWQWNGDQEDADGRSDYGRIDEFSDYEKAGISSLIKPPNLQYWLFWSMATKVEIFKKQDGLVLLDGLYFNESWDYSQKISPILIEQTDLIVTVQNSNLVILDAVSGGKSEVACITEGIHDTESTKFSSYAAISLKDGHYTVGRTEVSILVDNKTVLLKGVEINLC